MTFDDEYLESGFTLLLQTLMDLRGDTSQTM